MTSESADREKSLTPKTKTRRVQDQESILAALALLLGPETDYHLRVRTMRQLMRLGTAILPALLTALSEYPEITTPAWPWWPPQYEHLSRLVLHLSKTNQLPLHTLLHHPTLIQPPGPVLWTTLVEAAGLFPQQEYEPLLCEALTVPWAMTRYASGMALANLAGKFSLQASTLKALRAHLSEDEIVFVRLAAAYALLRSGDDNGSGVEALVQLLQVQAPAETRKAATFVLAAEPPLYLPLAQRERLALLLVQMLEDENDEIAANVARALGPLALPSTLPALQALLTTPTPYVQIAALSALEAVAARKSIRLALQQQALPAQIAPLLRSEYPQVRKQASYTLAACGGNYAAAVLGTALLNQDHPGQIEAIEGLRLLHGALRAPQRANILRWLLRALHNQQEEILVAALDSLAYLAWQAQNHGQRRALLDISTEVTNDGILPLLLINPSAWVRQRSTELIGILYTQPDELRSRLENLLRFDSDSGVRACVAMTLSQIGARWAIPALVQALLDPDQDVAETALNALSRLATPDDFIVVYVLKELTSHDHASEDGGRRLAQSAQALLKKWRRLPNQRRKLQSSQ